MPDDEMNMEDITPEDLGCMGEQEIDPGVVEETKKVSKPGKAVSIMAMFEKIPFEIRKKYRKFYDEFFTADGKDMPFEEFAVEYYLINSPLKMQYDLQEITAQKHDGYQQKAAVDFNLTHRN